MEGNSRHPVRSLTLPDWLPRVALIGAAVVVAVQPTHGWLSGPVPLLGMLLILAALAHLITSKNRRLLAQVVDRAVRDALTGAANWALFQDRLGEAMGRWQRGGPNVSVVALDLNDFKLVNDTLGHPAGDELLRAVAHRIGDVVRASDTLARIGGDEFAVLVEGDASAVTSVALRLAGSFDAPFAVDDRELFVYPSIGFASTDCPAPARTAKELLEQADAAMYAGKRTTEGRLTVVSALDGLTSGAPGDALPLIARPAPAGHAGALRLLGDFGYALSRSELFLVYQPKLDLAGGAIVGVEALLHWNHPEWGVLGPEEFLPLVRRPALIDRVTEFVVGTALDDLRRWQPCDLGMGINVFAASLSDAGLPGRLNEALSRRALDPRLLTVEIAEDMVAQDSETVRPVLTALRESGIRIAVDGFGRGYAGLRYLRELPIDEIKLDRCLISPISRDRRAAAMTQGVIDLAHAMDVIVVADGVEDAATAALLRRYRCDSAQGHHFSAPLTADQISSSLSVKTDLREGNSASVLSGASGADREGPSWNC